MSCTVATIAPSGLSTPSATEPGYFENPLPGNIILATFWVVTLPLAMFIQFNNTQLILWLYLWLFGMTHFVLTFTVYLNRGNLAHFGSTWRNRVIYFALPVIVFAAFDLMHVFHLRETFPLFVLYFFVAVRLMDFNHCTRQAFGVLQMFKAATRTAYPKQAKSLENYFFKVGTALMFTTFLAGGVSPFLQSGGPLTLHVLGWTLAGPILPIATLQIASAIMIVMFFGLLSLLIAHHWRARSVNDGAGTNRSAAYLLYQTGSMLLATMTFPLYAATLAMHYVEYQVLMYPRCFHCELDESSRLDRFFARLRQNPVIFYAAIILFAAVVTLFCYTGMGLTGMSTMDLTAPAAYLFLVALFDGLFVFHYIVEGYIWRFSDPYYRKSLSGLYFSARKR